MNNSEMRWKNWSIFAKLRKLYYWCTHCGLAFGSTNQKLQGSIGLSNLEESTAECHFEVSVHCMNQDGMVTLCFMVSKFTVVKNMVLN